MEISEEDKKIILKNWKKYEKSERQKKPKPKKRIVNK
jgi:hypothetical protein